MRPGLHVDDLTVRLPLASGAWVHALSDISLSVPAGSVTALVGESGSGKSVLGAAVLAMLPPSAYRAGAVTVVTSTGVLDVMSPAGPFRGQVVAHVPQAAAASFNPVRTVGSQLQEVVRVLRAERSVDELADLVALDRTALRRYPHQLSGGMAQRAAIAAALAGDPAVLVADEPTASLDADLADHTLQLLRARADAGAAVLLITHDLRSLLRRRVADQVAVLYASRLMEVGPAEAVLEDPWHDYTKDLLAALPENGLHPVPGDPPVLVDLPEECVYHLRRPGTTMSGGATALLERDGRRYRTTVGEATP